MSTNLGGAFAPGEPLALPDFGRAVRLEDVTGDGRPDALVLVRDGSVHLLPNEAGALGTLELVAERGGAVEIATADLDADGRLDLVRLHRAPRFDQPAEVEVLRGAGGLVPARSFATDRDPWSLAVGDLDGDGKPELVVGGTDPSDSSSRTLGVLPGR